MDFGSPPVRPESNSDQPFDVQGFKNLLTTLKESKEKQVSKAKPLYTSEE